MKNATRGIKSFILCLLFLLIGCSAYSQDQGESDFDVFRHQIQKEYFKVGTLLQTVGDYRYERVSGENGFSIGNARLQVKGVFDEKVGYQLQTSFIGSPSLLDANMYYNVTPNFSVKAGLFKAPFSYEYLTGATAIDFINRSSVVNQLVPKRQVGLQLQGKMAEGKFTYSAGMFNGNDFESNQNDDEQFLYTARLEANSGVGNDAHSSFMMGLNASYEQSERPNSGAGLLSQVEGEQILLGVDTRITYDKMMVAGEFIYSAIEERAGAEYNPYGFYMTGGYFVTPQTQLLARWDYFDGDFIGQSSESLIGGINIFPTEFTKVQLNYIYPVDDGVDFSQVLLNLQIGF